MFGAVKYMRLCGQNGDGCLSALILFRYEGRLWHLFVLSWARVRLVVLVVLFRYDVRWAI